MSEVTGRIAPYVRDQWQLISDDWRGPLCDPDGTHRVEQSNGGVWFFRRRIDAVAFARRKGIRLEET